MVRFGIIGTNKISHQFADAVTATKDAQISAVYSRSLKTAQTFAAPYQAEHCFDDLTAFCQSCQFDAAYIASPNIFHAEQAIALMAAGKHVLCEKPISASANQATQMIECAKSNNVCLMEAMPTSHLPNFKQIRQHLNKVGQIRLVQSSFCQYSSRYDKYKAGENPNTFNLAFANGALIDIGIYPLHVLVNLFGQPQQVQSQVVKLASGVDGCGDVLLQYPGFNVNIQYSKISNSSNITEIQGEKGRLLINHISLLNSLTFIANDGTVTELGVEQYKNGMRYELEHFVALVQAERTESDINTWPLSKQVIAIIDGIRQQQGIIYPSDEQK